MSFREGIYYLRESQHTPEAYPQAFPNPQMEGIPKHKVLVPGSEVCSRGMLENPYKVGPLPVITGFITLITRVIRTVSR